MRRSAESQVLDVSELRMRQATITAALWMTIGVVVLGGVYVGATWQRPHRLELSLLFGVSLLSALPVYLLRARIVRSRLREQFFLSWTLSDFAMLVAATLADGGTASPLVLVFFIPVVFSAMSYPLASVVTVGTASVISYLGVAIVAGGSSPGYHAGFAFALVCTGAMSAWQAHNHKRQRQTLQTVSRTDPLTGCLNRRGFQERAVAEIEAMRRRERTGAIVMLDIDHFKPVNDTLGHGAGDELLCWVVETLQRVVRSVDAVGRLGGDEFAVLLTETDHEEAARTGARIAAALGDHAPASLGIAVYPADGEDLETLTRCADARLYASRAGRYPQLPPRVHEPTGRGFGPTDLWRAALDAFPSRGSRGEKLPQSDRETALLDQIDASVLATDMDGVVISWNRGAETLYGWSAEEALGRNARELVVPEDTAQAEALVAELSRNGRWDGELLVRRKDGSLFTAYVRNRLVLDELGTPSAIVGVAVDISGRVAAETELIQSRDYARAVTECIGEGLFTVDVQGLITYANHTAETMLGWSADELRGQPLLATLGVGEADGTGHSFQEHPIAGALEHQEAVRVPDDVFLTETGRKLPVAYTAAPFHTHDGLQGCVVIFQDISDRKAREAEQRRDAARLATISRIESAVAEERFVLHAQPIIDLRTGETVQHELLLRMRETDGRIIAPGEFLPVAENSAMIGEIDWWVIKQATQLAGAGAPVELNLSARSVGDLDVLDHVERCIEQQRGQPGLLVFEITETAIVEDQQAARTFVDRLHALGCKVALDDFGTGYGTLTYLKQIPVDYLKLDIEFVRDLARSAASHHVVQAVVSLARDFGLQTVGEGVEDADTLELLCQLGVDFAQGFHIARPEPFTERPGDRREPVRIGARPVGQTDPHRAPVRRLLAAGERRGAPARRDRTAP